MVTGDVEVRDNSQLDIAAGDTCLIDGDLLVHGNGSMDVEGYLQVTGDVTTSGNGSVCGTGITEVWGNISGSGWCMGLSVLPVELLSFNGSLDENQQIVLKWATATENNNSHFLLEKSSDGLDFQFVTEVQGAGNSSEETRYAFTDTEPLTGTSYYRLTQVDLDGQTEVFDILAVQVEDNSAGICELNVVPNPCVPSCTAVLTDCGDQMIRAEIMDAGGNYIQQLVPVKTGKDAYSFHLNEDNLLAPGMYIISAATQRQRTAQKIVVK